MRKYLLAAAAAAAIASPAAARDHSGYIGVDAGLLLSTHTNVHIDATNSYYCSGGEGGTYFGSYFTNCQATFKTHYKTGFDGDIVGGYDFGMFRLEGELGYKYAGHDRYSVTGLGSVSGSGHSDSWSAMVNGLVDFGPDRGINFSLGGGAGYAHVRYRFGVDDPNVYYADELDTTLSKGRFAWQLLAEARAPVSSQMDIGLKYRYFDAGTLRETFDDGAGGTFNTSTHIRSHSILASLIYNFTPPPPPPAPPVVEAPPPPPPPPATQTCPDGSVILATATCPAPPPPPPPPPAERGERGE
jgi:opacity protein-like surface antigen